MNQKSPWERDRPRPDEIIQPLAKPAEDETHDPWLALKLEHQFIKTSYSTSELPLPQALRQTAKFIEQALAASTRPLQVTDLAARYSGHGNWVITISAERDESFPVD